MVITKDTELSEILVSSKVVEIMAELDSGINKIVDERTGALESEMSSGGITEETIISGRPILYNRANKVVEKYNKVTEIASPFIKGVCTASVNKEIEELTDLRSKVRIALEQCIDDISNAEIELADIKSTYGTGWTEETPAVKDQNNVISGLKLLKEKYEEKIQQIDQRLASLESTAESYGLDIDITLKNEIPTFELDENGKPKSTPYNFTVDSHHRLDVPGFGVFYEASGGNSVEYHYDPNTNLFYWDDAGTDWANYDYSDNFYAVTPEEMQNSEIKGGVMPG